MRFQNKLTGILLLLTTTCLFAGGSIKGKIIHKKKRWIRNTVVYLENVNGDWKPEDISIAQKGSTFIPKFAQIIKGATVTFLNSDPTVHNVYSPDNEKYDLGTKPQGGKLIHKFDKLGIYTQLCKLHPTMLAYVFVLQNPFFGRSNDAGNFIIENIPAGKHKLIIWNERYKGDPVEVVVKDGATVEVEIKLHR